MQLKLITGITKVIWFKIGLIYLHFGLMIIKVLNFCKNTIRHFSELFLIASDNWEKIEWFCSLNFSNKSDLLSFEPNLQTAILTFGFSYCITRTHWSIPSFMWFLPISKIKCSNNRFWKSQFSNELFFDSVKGL